MKNNRIPVLPKDWQKQIAEEVGCSTVWVYKSIYKKARGRKAENCKQMYARFLGIKENVKIL